MKYVAFPHGMVMETTNYTVMCCSKMKSEAGGLWKGKEKKYKMEKRKVRNVWYMLEEK